MRRRPWLTCIGSLVLIPLAGCSTTEVPGFLRADTSRAPAVSLPNQYAGTDPSDPGLRKNRKEQERTLSEAELRAQAQRRMARAGALWNEAERTRDLEEAADIYGDIVDDYPEYPRAAEARFLQGRSLFRAGEYAAAVRYLREYMAIAPVNPHLAEIEEMIFRSGTGYLAESTGLLAIFRTNEEGLEALRFVARHFPAGDYADDALLRLAEYYREDDDLDQAVLVYKELLRRYPDSEWSFRARRGLAETYVARDQGDPYHAGFVDRDPREEVPDDERAKAHAGPVKGGLELALEQYDIYLERIARDPGRRLEYAAQVREVEQARRRVRAQLAAKEERIAAWYASQGNAAAADIYRRSAARWRRGEGSAAVPVGSTPAPPVTAPPTAAAPGASRAAPPSTPMTPMTPTAPRTRLPVPPPPPPPAWPPGSRFEMRGRTTPRVWVLGALTLVAAGVGGVAGCSYSTRRLTDFPAARTIAVLPFENTGFRRDLELRLSSAVAREIRARTSLALSTAQTADLVMRGSMGAEEFAIGLDENGVVIQKRLEGWLRVEVTDRLSGRVVRRARVRATEEFQPGPRGGGLEGPGTEEWVRRIAEQVVQSLEMGF